MVDLDLGKYFDRVNYDVVMVRAATRVMCVRLPRLIGRYQKGGIMIGGVNYDHKEATPLFLVLF